jgi:ribonucleoside-diphosphate reductase alpha chain
LFRVLGVEYLHRYDFAQVPPTAAEMGAPTSEIVPSETGHDADAPKPRGLLSYEAHAETFVHDTLRPGPASEGGVASSLDAQLEEMMGDAPVCDGCGHITVRNGACYKCLNCGNSMGCS